MKTTEAHFVTFVFCFFLILVTYTAIFFVSKGEKNFLVEKVCGMPGDKMHIQKTEDTEVFHFFVKDKKIGSIFVKGTNEELFQLIQDKKKVPQDHYLVCDVHISNADDPHLDITLVHKNSVKVHE